MASDSFRQALGWLNIDIDSHLDAGIRAAVVASIKVVYESDLISGTGVS
ncbi:hypothetical protein [Mycolicibacterium aubagnense]|nr:hypothetical protein [Mycolicibacterium aubagnense]